MIWIFVKHSSRLTMFHQLQIQDNINTLRAMVWVICYEKQVKVKMKEPLRKINNDTNASYDKHSRWYHKWPSSNSLGRLIESKWSIKNAIKSLSLYFIISIKLFITVKLMLELAVQTVFKRETKSRKNI